MNQLVTLIRREYWEHRGTFMVLPAVVTAVVVVLSLVLFIGVYSDAVHVDVDADFETGSEHHQVIIENGTPMELYRHQLSKMASLPEPVREQRLDQFYTGISVLWFVVLLVVIFFYLIGALYDDRRDRSVLFWKSMPVSDTLTVASKVLAGLVLAPLIYLGFVMIAHLAITIIASMATIGQDVPVWEALWAPANFVTRWIGFLALFGFTILWSLPFFAWLLLVSSWAKSAPLAWAVGVPLLVVMLEGLLFSTQFVGEFIRAHVFFWEHARALLEYMDLPEALQFASSLIVGMVFLALAVWQRGKADEI